MPPLLQLQKMSGGKTEGGKKHFGSPADREFVEKVRLGASYSTGYCLLLDNSDHGPLKMPLKLAV